MGFCGSGWTYLHLHSLTTMMACYRPIKSLEVVQAADFLSCTRTCYTVVMTCVAELYTMWLWYLCIMLDIVLQQTLIIICS